MSADAAAVPVPETAMQVEVPAKDEETAASAAGSSSAAPASDKPRKTMVAELPKKQPADIADAAIDAGILTEAPPARDGKTEDEVRELAANAAQLSTSLSYMVAYPTPYSAM